MTLLGVTYTWNRVHHADAVAATPPGNLAVAWVTVAVDGDNDRHVLQLIPRLPQLCTPHVCVVSRPSLRREGQVDRVELEANCMCQRCCK